MVKLVEIGGLLKKGLGQNVVKKFAENSEVISVGFANGRASDMFDIQQFGDASEADILTLIVKEKKSNSIFDELYNHLKLSNQRNGIIFKFNAMARSTIK